MRKLTSIFPSPLDVQLHFSIRNLGVVFIFFFLFSCKGVQKAKKISEHIEKKPYVISVNDHATKEITLDYIGCSGFLIRRGNEAVLNDPYFSNLGPLYKVLFKKVQTDTAEVEKFFNDQFDQGKDLTGIIKFVTVTHSHYDHLGDVPTKSICLANITNDGINPLCSARV